MSSPPPGSELSLSETGQQAFPAQEPLDSFLNLEFWPAEPDYRNDSTDTMQWLQQLHHLPPAAEEQPAAPLAAGAAQAAQLLNHSNGEAADAVRQPWSLVTSQATFRVMAVVGVHGRPIPVPWAPPVVYHPRLVGRPRRRCPGGL